MDVVILAAGRGTRLDAELPKCLVKVRRQKRIIDYQLEFIESMVSNAKIHVVAGYKFDLVREHLSDHDVNLIHNPFYDCSGIVGSAWLSLSHITSPDVWRIDGDVIFTKSLKACDRTTFFANCCHEPRETAYLETIKETLTGIGFASDYTGAKEWSCSEVYRNGDYQTVVSGARHLVKEGHYFEAVNHAIHNNLIDLPWYETIEGVFEIDTKEDLKNARKKLSHGKKVLDK